MRDTPSIYDPFLLSCGVFQAYHLVITFLTLHILVYHYIQHHYLYALSSRVFSIKFYLLSDILYLYIPVAPDTPCNPLPAVNSQIMSLPPTNPVLSSHKCPARPPSLIGTNAAFLIPDHI